VDITLHWERHADAKLVVVQTAAEYGCHILLQSRWRQLGSSAWRWWRLQRKREFC
jgi:hypothetical protein